MTTTETFRIVWTRRAIGQYRRGGAFDPRHTNSNVPLDLASPWLRDDLRRRYRAPWIVIDADGHIVIDASAPEYVTC